MTRVSIVGVGLIGGSLGMALRRVRRQGRRSYHVTGVVLSASQLRAARAKGAIDAATTRLSDGVSQADVVVLAVPVHVLGAVAGRLVSSLKRGAIVMDTGSVKQSVVKQIRAALRRRSDVSFVGAHPLAGSERAGLENASATLFRKAPLVLTPAGSARAVKTARKLWSDAGARCVVMNAAEHDRWLAATSHLPHLISFALFSTVSSELRGRAANKALVAGSFRDMTRVAAADPVLWTGIFGLNKVELLRVARRFQNELAHLQSLSPQRLVLRLARLSAGKKAW